MDIGRGFLLSNFGVIVFFFIIFLALVFSKLGKKWTSSSDSLSSIRSNFKKKHPKTYTILEKGSIAIIWVLFSFVISLYINDLIFFKVKTLEGKVKDVSYSRILTKKIYLENGDCFSGVFMPEISEGKTYRIYYVPNTYTIVKVDELENK